MRIFRITLCEVSYQYLNEHAEPEEIQEAKQNHHDALYLADQVVGGELAWVRVVEVH
jgi:hypothetical protein